MSALRKVALAILAAKVLLVPVLFDPTAYVVFAHPKALAAHGLGLILLGSLIALLIRYGRRILPVTPLHLAVGGVVAATSLATVFAIDRQLALFGILDRQLGLVSLLDNVTLYFAIVTLVRSRTELVVVAAAAAIATLTLLGYAVVQRSGLDPLDWRSGIATERPFAMLGNPGNLGQFFGTIAAATASALLAWWPRMTRIRRSAVASWTLLAVLGALLAGARAVGLGLSAAAVLVGVLAIVRWIPNQWRVLAGTGAVVVLALGLGVGGREILGTGLDLVTGRMPITEGSIAGRVDLYRVALSQVAERPLLGVGPDNYVVEYPRHRSPQMTRFHESDAPQTSPHSWLLKLATDSGALGLVAYAVLFGVASWLALRHGALGLVGLAAVVSFLATGTVSISDVGTEWMLWAGLGLIALSTRMNEVPAPPIQEGRRRVPSRPRVGPIRAGLPWVAIALGIALALFQYNALDASHAAASSRQSRQRASPDFGAAIASAQRAVAQDPSRAEYWHELGLALAANGGFRAAEDAFRRAADAAPYQAVYLINLAKAQVAIGQGSRGRELAEALATARRAVATDPHVADVQYTLALALYVNDQFAEAAAASERAWAIRPSPGSESGFEVAVRAYRQIGRPADAERWARAAIVALGNTFEWQLVVAQTLLDQGRTNEALAQVDAALLSRPNDPAGLALRKMIMDRVTK